MCNNTSFTVLQVNIATNINLHKKIFFPRTLQQHKNSNNQALFLGINPQVLLSMVITEARGKQKLTFLMHQRHWSDDFLPQKKLVTRRCVTFSFYELFHCPTANCWPLFQGHILPPYVSNHVIYSST